MCENNLLLLTLTLTMNMLRNTVKTKMTNFNQFYFAHKLSLFSVTRRSPRGGTGTAWSPLISTHTHTQAHTQPRPPSPHTHKHTPLPLELMERHHNYVDVKVVK